MERYPTSEEKHGGQKRSRALWRKMLSRREGFQRTSDEGGQQGRPHWQWELELTFSLVRDPRCWERLKTGREGDDRGWDGGVASPTPWTWAWASSGRWGRTGKPGLPAVYTVTKSRTQMSDWTKKKNMRWNNQRALLFVQAQEREFIFWRFLTSVSSPADTVLSCQRVAEVNHPPSTMIPRAPSEEPRIICLCERPWTYSWAPRVLPERAPRGGRWSAAFGTSRCSGHLLPLLTGSGSSADGTGSVVRYPYVIPLFSAWEAEQPSSRCHQGFQVMWLPLSPWDQRC